MMLWWSIVGGVLAVVLACGAEAAAGGKVEVGLATGPAARLAPEDRARLAEWPVQDLLDPEQGRYTQLQDEGGCGYWGLEALRARQEAAEKPYAELQRGRFLQSERVIYADPTTGATLMKLTDEPYGRGDELNYFGKSCYSADGSLLTWQRSRRPTVFGPARQSATATHGPVLAAADGTQLHVVQGWPAEMSAPICHPLNPELGYAMEGGRLLELDLRAEQVRRVVATGLPSWWLKLSPDGKYALNASWDSGRMVVVSLAEGAQWEIKATGQIHDSYRFLPADTDWVMFWYEPGRSGRGNFRLHNFKTGEERVQEAYFDWNHGDLGRTVGVHESGNVYHFDGEQWRVAGNAWWPSQTQADEPPFYNIPADFNGYCQYWPDDQLWAFGTLITERPYLSEMVEWFAKPLAGGRANRFRVCLTNLRRQTDRKGEKAEVLDRPNISPDGTKLLFNSNAFNTSEVYQVVVRNPRPPEQVAAQWTPRGARVTWQAPPHAREVAGYLVYRSEESGRGFEPLFVTPLVDTHFADSTARAGRAYHYAVRAVEHSGLESALSAEAAAASEVKVLDRAPVRVFVEAEAALPADLEAPSPDALWLSFDGLASDLYYLWQRRADRAGAASLPVTVPRAGEYYVFARLKGARGAAFTVAGRALSLAPAKEWQWVRSARPVALAAGAQQLLLTSDRYGSSLDCLYLATDAGFRPTGRIRASVPAALTLGTKGARLTWSGAKPPRWSHYNLYTADQAGFVCDQHTLLASPDQPEHLDWSAPAGEHYYRVTQVTRDGLESAPSNEVKLAR